MQRRTFLIQSLAAGLSAQTPAGLSDRIGISSWSFHNFFSSTLDEKLPKLTKSWDLRDFPEMIADRYRVHQLEMVAPHFESTKLSYVREVKSRLARAHSHLVNIPVDIDELGVKGGLSDPDPKIRETALSACTRWIDIARELGEHCGALPDMGNFPDEATRQRGLPLLYPYASTVSHAKGLEFDEHGIERA